MSVVSTVWLLIPYLCRTGALRWCPFAEQRGGPLGMVLADWSFLPAVVTIVLALIGFVQPRRRRRWLGVIAIATVCVAFPILMPGLWR
jgi:hypothetical protein